MQPNLPPPFQTPYRRPTISVGELVLWSNGGLDEEARSPALVTNIGDRTIQLSVFSAAHGQAKCKDGVYHIDDPLRKKGNRGDNGCWEYGPGMKLLIAVISDLEFLTGKHGKLDARVDRTNIEVNRLRKRLRGYKAVEGDSADDDESTPVEDADTLAESQAS